MHDVKARNNIKIFGNGPKTIMMAHGFGCDQSMWRFMVPHFEQEYRIVLFDHVGSGNSDLSSYDFDKYSNLYGYAADLLEIIDAVGEGAVIYIGHSVSAMIGILASIEKPDFFEQIMMVGPSPRYLNHEDYIGGFNKEDIDELLQMMEMNFVGWATYLAPIVMNNADRPALTQELEASFCSSSPAITRQFAEVTFFSDHREELPQVSVPTLIMQCSEDSVVPMEVGDYLHRHLRNSTLRLMRAKGHYPHISHPDETIAIIKEYLSTFKSD